MPPLPQYNSHHRGVWRWHLSAHRRSSWPMSDFLRTIFDSSGFGDVVVTRTDDRCSAQFGTADSPVVTIERIGPPTRPSIPIGTRDASCLVARVNDRPMKVLPGPGRVRRRSYRVVVEIDDRVLTLEPKSEAVCRFLNGRPGEIDQSFCVFILMNNGTVCVEWATPTTTEVRGHTVEPPRPTDEDVLIGFALAAAFGIGSLSVVSIIIGFIGAIG
ncbi:hypothetical protein [Nocardia sp. NPDC052566]|uniref:hypothetical protein n=1 Tax=Nocardia sp. NPDC052566 TaxID=3364330 RepID=UPI0037C5C2C7